ncbi:MAG: AAA family ATPase, partial [Bacteroidota bacterium]
MIKTPDLLFNELVKNFPHQPTFAQKELLIQLSSFVFDKNERALFLVKGYAGTGKTTIISTLVNNLWRAGFKSVMMAPTGRAAKVIANYSGKQAFTIHKKIYFPQKSRSGGVNFTLQQNRHTNTIFIIDEASMIPDRNPDAKLFDSSSLLDDLILYAYSGKNCKIIFVGDTAQLPPVKLELSPALDKSTISYNFLKDVVEVELDEVMRQHQNSGILANATKLRSIIQERSNETF